MKKKAKIILLVFVLLTAALIVFISMRGESKNTGILKQEQVSIVAGEECQDVAKTLVKSLKAANIPTVITNSTIEGGRTILLGETGEEASVAARLALRNDDYSISFGKEYIVIVGGSYEKTKEAAEYFATEYVEYYATYSDFPYGDEYTITKFGDYNGTLTKQILLNGVSAENYVIVTEDGKKTEAAVLLQEVVLNSANIQLDIIAVDDVKDNQYAIVFGSSQDLSAKSYADKLNGKEAWLYQEDNRLYICGATEAGELMATKMLITKHMQYDYSLKQSALKTIELENTDFAFTYDWDEMTAPQTAQAMVFSIPTKDDFSVQQGGCTDGKYGYFIVNKQVSVPYTNLLYKVDMKTFEVVAVSEELELEHANSITYNRKTNELISVNYDPSKTILTIVDPETLEVKRTVDVGFNALSLAYSEELDMYVAGMLGTYNFFLLDSDFNVVEYCTAVQSTAVKQEVECDGERIWFIMSDDNIVYTYDWKGNFLYSIELGGFTEAENIIFVGDYAYVGYFSNGGKFYETIFYQEISK